MATSLNPTNKLDIDDTQSLSCSFLHTETVDDHVVYIVRVQRGFDPKYSWQIKKRYNEFNELYAQLKLSNYELPLPPKKAFGNMKREFLSSRQLGLQEFMDSIFSNLLLSNSLPVKKFLDKENYTENFKELALAHVSMFFRSESNWQVLEPLNDIGLRFRKKHILLKNTDIPNNKYILTWSEHGPDKLLKEPELKSIFQQFTQIQHEYIEPIMRINTGDSSTITIQKFNEKFVSLRDYICGANIELIDVYGFGLILYEMVYGEAMLTSSSKQDFNDCSDKELKQVLDIILVDDVLVKTGLPTINQLLEMPFFKNIDVDILPTSSTTAAASTTNASNSNVKLFTSSKTKELLNKAREHIEKRLNDEQKFLHKFRRQSQAEARILSEEEIRKRRKEKKKAEKEAINTLEFPTPTSSPLRIGSINANKNKNSSLSSSLRSDSASNFSGVETPPPTPSIPSPALSSAFSSNNKRASGPPAPPPPPPPPIGGPPAPPPPPVSSPSVSQDRSQLLSSISGFSKGGLRKAKTIDKSAPKL